MSAFNRDEHNNTSKTFRRAPVAPGPFHALSERGLRRLLRTPMNKKLKLINDAFDALRWTFDHCNVNHAETLLELCKQEENGHRGFMDGFARCHPDAISITQAAKLFAVKRIAGYLLGEKFPQGKDYLHTHKSCFLAAGIVDEFAQEVRTEWSKFDLYELAALDYTEFVKVRSVEVSRD